MPKLTPLIALAGIALAGGAAVSGSVAYVRLAARGRLYDEQSVPAAPVALVLGAQVYPDGRPSRFLTGRLELARRLYAAEKITEIIVSGDSLAPEGDEPAAMRRYLVEAGVPERAIRTDPVGFDTYDSCVRARLVFGADRLLIVTQQYHLPRAVGTARLIGLDAVGVGDRSVEWVHRGGRRRRSQAWIRGVLREQIACGKTVIDVVSRRRPLLLPLHEGGSRS